MPSKRRNLLAASGSAGGTLGYVEDVFSTFLYTGNGAIRTITNGLDLDGEGGMVWIKNRTASAENPVWDSTRSYTEGVIRTNASNSLYTSVTDMWTGFTASGFTLGADIDLGWVNTNADNYVSWTFRKAEKFFDVVEYTGNGTAGRTVAHNLGSVPAMMIVKRLDSSASWGTYHKDLTSAAYSLIVNEAGGEVSFPSLWNSTAPTDTVFTVGDNSSPPNSARTNSNGGNFVAYLFASDAGGFGDDGDENIIKCGTWTENGANNITIDCGFEPEFVMFKCAGAASSWYMVDSMRGIPTPLSGTATGNYINTVLQANATTAETSANAISLTSTGFIFYADGRLTNTAKWVYIAVRMPMKTPTAGTEVFAVSLTNTSTTENYTSGFPVDVATDMTTAVQGHNIISRLTGTGYMQINSTTAENAVTSFTMDSMTGWSELSRPVPYFSYMFKRATGFMDVVAYTGTGGTSTQAHNLGVVPELMIFKRRDGYAWNTYVASSVLASAGPTKYLELNDSATIGTDSNFLNGAPTSSLINTGSNTNQSTKNYIAYLFATLAGVSKVGSYTGTGSDLNVDCGFSAGARFFFTKRTDSSGDWYTYDSLRGISAGNDPYLLLNTTAAQVTGTDYVDPLAAGITLTAAGSSTINVSGGTYIFLAIA